MSGVLYFVTTFLPIRDRVTSVAWPTAANRASGVRLVQAAFHNRSLSLYTNLGFDVREPLSCVQGRTTQRSVAGCTVRAAQPKDLENCVALSHRIHGFDRSTELGMGIHQNTAFVVERDNRITGYASSLAFFGHATAETNSDMQALIASADSFAGSGILVPTRNSVLLRWCLANGLRRSIQAINGRCAERLATTRELVAIVPRVTKCLPNARTAP